MVNRHLGRKDEMSKDYLSTSVKYNRYIYPLQPCRHLTLKLLIQGHPWSAKVPHIADFKSAYISLIIGPRGL